MYYHSYDLPSAVARDEVDRQRYIKTENYLKKQVRTIVQFLGEP